LILLIIFTKDFVFNYFEYFYKFVKFINKSKRIFYKFFKKNILIILIIKVFNESCDSNIKVRIVIKKNIYNGIKKI
jgi:hypothetical protein